MKSRVAHLILTSLMLAGITFTSLSAKELTIAFPMNLPPWTIQEKDAGITVDVVREALKIAGHTMKTKYIDLGSMNQAIDAASDANAQVENPKITGHYSEKVMIFQTSLIGLQSNQSLQIKTLKDLENKRLIAFQNAHFLFGKEFEQLTKSNPRYQELADQEKQVAMLYQEEAEVILADKNIFLYFRRINNLTDTSPHYKMHYVKGLTEPSPAFVVFRDQQLRDDFNFGLKKLTDNKDYYRIVAKYVR